MNMNNNLTTIWAPKQVIAIDFDLTICDSKYPLLGDRIKGAKKYINKLHAEGYGIVINTCRTDTEAHMAIEWLDDHGINYHYFNCNFPYRIDQYRQDCRKISADLYIDDKQIGKLPSWKEIYKYIKITLV